jgi:hypothetical protein
MQDSAGYFIVGCIILLFTIGSGSLLMDSLLNKPMDISPPNLEPEYASTKVSASYTVTFLKEKDDLSIL